LIERGGIYADLYRLQFQDGKTLLDPKGMAAQQPTARAQEQTVPNGWIRRLMTRILG
jgi:ATP-binding cassette subfamily B protein